MGSLQLRLKCRASQPPPFQPARFLEPSWALLLITFLWYIYRLGHALACTWQQSLFGSCTHTVEAMSELDTSEAGGLTFWMHYGKNATKRMWQQGRLGRKSREMFLVGAADTHYDTLPGPTWIRLLKLEAGSPGSVLRCSLRQVDLQQSPSYNALSYTWKQDPTIWGAMYSVAKNFVKAAFQGESLKVEVPENSGELERSELIVCNGKATKIFPNLYNALLQLRRDRPGEYWIDALCINQSDVEERTSQVQLMDRIYQSAELVVVWLGTSANSSVEGMPHLEHIVNHDINLPPMRSLYQGRKLIIPPELDIAAKDVWLAYGSALSIVSSQWFKRVWVLQELCLAKRAIFFLDEKEVSIKAVKKGFGMAQEYLDLIDSTSDPDKEFNSGMASKFGPAPLTLQAREDIQNAGLWTLCQWLLACRGRSATDSRDLIFGGLSLIKPELLRPDSSLIVAEPTHTTMVSKSLFTRRIYYPDTLPPQGMKANALRPLLIHENDSTIPSASETQIVLWPTLKADYTANVVEVFFNAAACLLTHTGTKEILSLAARTSRRDQFTTEWVEVPDDKIALEEIPSWVPTPGTWISTINESLAFRNDRRYNAGREARKKPAISSDGMLLFLDAVKFDHIESFILDENFIDDMTFEQLRNLLIDIAKIDSGDTKRNPLDDLAHVLLQSSEESLSQSNIDATPRWLRYTLTHAVYTHMIERRSKQFSSGPRRWNFTDLLNEDYEKWHSANYASVIQGTDELIDLFEHVQATFRDDPWPHWAEARFSDLNLYQGFLEAISQYPTKGGLQPKTDNVGTSKSSQKNKNSATKQHGEWVNSLSPEYEPIDPESQTRLTIVAKSTLAWKRVFVTRNGRIGIGPKSLSCGDMVMLVRGAPVPYAFTPLDVDLGRQERDIRVALDENNKAYNKTTQSVQNRKKKSALRPIDALLHRRDEGKLQRLDREWIKRQAKLDRVSKRVNVKDAWVLQAEVYIEGIMDGEGIKDDATERIIVA